MDDVRGLGLSQEILNNLAHAPVYGVLTFLVIQSFEIKTRKILCGAFMFSLLYGALLEIFQSFVPHRCSSLMDVALNALGSLTVLAFYKNILIQPKGMS